MYNSIYQLSENPIDLEELSPSEYGMDNVDIDRFEEIALLMHDLSKHGATYNKTNNYVVFPKGFKESYFKYKFESLKKIVNDLTLEVFANSPLEAYKIERMVDNKLESRIDLDGSLTTISSFVRELECETEYYIGSISRYRV